MFGKNALTQNCDKLNEPDAAISMKIYPGSPFTGHETENIFR